MSRIIDGKEIVEKDFSYLVWYYFLKTVFVYFNLWFQSLTDTKVYGVVAVYAHELAFIRVVAVNFIEVCTAGA